MARKNRRRRERPAYGVSAYGWTGGPYWGPGGMGQYTGATGDVTSTGPPLSQDQFGSDAAVGSDASSGSF